MTSKVAETKASPDSVLDCGDWAMRIAADGTWFHEGSPIGRKPLVRLFSRVLRADASGQHWLITPVERGRVAVEDSAFTAVEVEQNHNAFCLRTNLDQWVRIGAEHPLRMELGAGGEPRPYIALWRGLEARILRAPFYHLVEMAQRHNWHGESHMGIVSEEIFFPLDCAHGTPACATQPAEAVWGNG